METTDTINYLNIVNATVHADNSADDSRVFDIAADLFVQNDRVSSVNGGTVADRATGTHLGSFGENTDGSLNLSVQGDVTQRVAVLEAVSAFCSEARASASLRLVAETTNE